MKKFLNKLQNDKMQNDRMQNDKMETDVSENVSQKQNQQKPNNTHEPKIQVRDPLVNQLTLEQCKQLKVGDKIDFQYVYIWCIDIQI